MTAPRFDCVLFDWGGTLMEEEGGPPDVPLALWREVRAFDGAHATLAALAPHVRIGIATNATVSTRPLVELALRRVDLARYISHVFCFTEIGARKDSARFWAHVFTALNLAPGRILMIGDTLEQDVVAPRAHGVFSVWFNRARRSDEAAAGLPSIASLHELVPIVFEEA